MISVFFFRFFLLSGVVEKFLGFCIKLSLKCQPNGSNRLKLATCAFLVSRIKLSGCVVNSFFFEGIFLQFCTLCFRKLNKQYCPPVKAHFPIKSRCVKNHFIDSFNYIIIIIIAWKRMSARKQVETHKSHNDCFSSDQPRAGKKAFSRDDGIDGNGKNI